MRNRTTDLSSAVDLHISRAKKVAENPALGLAGRLAVAAVISELESLRAAAARRAARLATSRPPVGGGYSFTAAADEDEDRRETLPYGASCVSPMAVEVKIPRAPRLPRELTKTVKP